MKKKSPPKVEKMSCRKNEVNPRVWDEKTEFQFHYKTEWEQKINQEFFHKENNTEFKKIGRQIRFVIKWKNRK